MLIIYNYCLGLVNLFVYLLLFQLIIFINLYIVLLFYAFKLIKSDSKDFHKKSVSNNDVPPK